MTNGLLFHMTQPTSKSILKPSHAVSQPLANIRANENNGTIVDQCKQRGAVSYRIGERLWQSFSQPTPFIIF